MNAITNRLRLAALVAVALLAAACSGVPKSSSGGGGGGGGAATPHTIGGTVTGLTGTGLVLQDNGGDNLTVTAAGAFTFKTSVATGAKYAVTVSTQPTSPAQVCSVTNGSGTVSANVTNVSVTCGTATIPVGGSVTGLAGTGLVLQNNAGDDLTVTANGSFTFATLLVSGATYNVTIKTQPTGPAQICTVSNGTGTATAAINTVQVVCPVVNLKLSGTVVGLLGNGGGMELHNNGGDNLTVTGNGSFTFATQLAFGGAYNVSVFIQPGSQPQPCVVFGGSGTATADVSSVVVDCGHNDWTWIRGSKTSDATGTKAPPPVAPAVDTNMPGARNYPATWTDTTGRLWLFSGFGFSWDSTILFQPLYLNEMWVYQGASIYCAAPACVPGPWTLVPTGGPAPRWGAVTWTDAAGQLWLFGGQDASTGFLNDLWKFDPGTTTWTFVKGTLLDNKPGIYGTQGTAAAGNMPGGRWAADAKIDASGNVWLFGGQGFDSTTTNGLLNDLWKYNPTTNQWTWVGGSKLVNQVGSYGTLGTASAANIPGGRQAAASWIDPTGNLFVFGGFGLDVTGTPNGTLNDLWKYDPVANQWTWVSGSSAANQHGVYGTPGTAAATNVPGGRWRSAYWTDASGNLWLFGGFGLDSTGTGLLNDLWEYKGGQWIWQQGSNNNSQIGSYGIQSIPSVLNTPGARWGAGFWTDTNNQLWLFGGQGYDSAAGSGNGLLNDQWRYLPYP